MKLIISSAFFAALLTSASANPCESAGNNAAVDILYANGCQYRSVPSDNTSSGCGDKARAARACKHEIGRYISQGWCDGVSHNVRRLKEQCQDKVLENEETGSEEEVVFSEDSGDNEDEDATVLAANTYLRSNCGRYESAGPAVMKADQIVVDLWRRSGERCGYANSVFPEQAKAALRKEFPDNCWENENAFNANKLARQHGERKINEIVSSCSRPSPPSGCSSWDDYDMGVQITKRLGISCWDLDFGNIRIQEELVKRRANNCVKKGAFDEFNRIKHRCGKQKKSVNGYSNKSGKNGKDLQIE